MPLSRNTAIGPRVTTSVGQNSGGFAEHPDVMPAATSASTHGKNGSFAGTSANVGVSPPATAWRKLATVFALSPSVRELSDAEAVPITRPLTVLVGLEK